MTAKHLRDIFTCDPVAGILIWKHRPITHFASPGSASRWNKLFAGKKAGSLQNGYVRIHINGKRLMAHRVIVEMCDGWLDESLDVDHINLDRADNKRSNLRVATRSQNNSNRRARKTNPCGLKGATLHKGRWEARIGAEGKMKHLGMFPTAQEAHEAYCAASTTFHGKFARTT